MQKTYAIQFTGPGLDYVRQILGQRPYDEAGALIANVEQQRAQQDKPAAPAEVAPPAAVKRTPRKPKADALNGAGSHQTQ